MKSQNMSGSFKCYIVWYNLKKIFFIQNMHLTLWNTVLTVLGFRFCVWMKLGKRIGSLMKNIGVSEITGKQNLLKLNLKKINILVITISNQIPNSFICVKFHGKTPRISNCVWASAFTPDCTEPYRNWLFSKRNKISELVSQF